MYKPTTQQRIDELRATVNEGCGEHLTCDSCPTALYAGCEILRDLYWGRLVQRIKDEQKQQTPEISA